MAYVRLLSAALLVVGATSCLFVPAGSDSAQPLSIACDADDDCPPAWRCELVRVAADDCREEDCITTLGRCAPPGDATVDPAPVVVTTDEDTAVTLMLLPPGEAGRVVLREAPTHGTLTLDEATGAAQYVPAADFAGIDTVGYVVVDGAFTSAPRIATLTVQPVNDAPRAPAAPALLLLDEDGAAAAALTVVDVDGDALRWSLVTDGQRGRCALSPDTGLLVYQPDADVHGDDACALLVDDGHGGTLTVAQPVRILPVDDPPRLATPPTLLTREDQPLVVSLGGAEGCPSADDAGVIVCDIDTPYAALAVDIAELADLEDPGTAVPLTSGAGLTTWTYAPPPDFAGLRSFVLTVGDGTASVAAAFVVEVVPVADPASALEDVVDLDEDEGVAFALAAESVDRIRFEIVAAPGLGRIEDFDAAAGRGRYVPRRDFAGEERLTFVVLNDEGQASAPATVTFRVAPVNDPPTVTLPEGLAVDEDGELVLDVADVVVDVDGDATLVVASAAPGATAVADGRLRFAPPANFTGVAVWTVTADDGAGPVTTSKPVTVRPAADAPAIAPASLIVDEDASGFVDLVAVSPDGPPRFELAQPAVQGVAVLDATSGRLTYTPSPDYAGTDVVVVRAVRDGPTGPLPSALLPVTIDVRPRPDPPHPRTATLSMTEDEAASFAFADLFVDPDGDAVVVVAATFSAGDAVVAQDTQTLRLQPAPDVAGTADLLATVAHDGGTVELKWSVVVAAVQDTPVVTTTTLQATEDTPLTQLIAVRSPDGRATLSVVEQTLGGAARFLDPQTGLLEYRPRRDFAGTDGILITATLGQASSSTLVAVNVVGVDDPPVRRTQPVLVVQQLRVGACCGAATFDQSDFFTDVDDDLEIVAARFARGRATVTPRSLPSGAGAEASAGAAGLTSAGSGGDVPVVVAAGTEARVTLLPGAGEVSLGDDTLVLDVRDGQGAVQSMTFPLFIAGVPDEVAVTSEDNGATIALRPALPGSGAPVLSLGLDTPPQHGTATIVGRNLLYAPAADFAGVDLLRVQATIGDKVTRAEVRVTVTAVDDPPDFAGATVFVNEDATDADDETAIVLSALDPDDDVRFTFARVGPDPSAPGDLLDDGPGIARNTRRLRYRPRPDKNGVDIFDIAVDDGASLVTDQLVVIVRPVADAPEARNVAAAGDEDTPLLVFFDAEDADGDPLTLSGFGALAFEPDPGVPVPAAASATQLVITNGVAVFEPPTDFSGRVSFDYDARDGVASARARAVLTIRPVNDRPTVLPPTRDLFLGSPSAPTAIPIVVNPVPPVASATALVVLDVDNHSVGEFAFTPGFGRFGGAVDGGGVYRVPASLSSLRDEVDLGVTDRGGGASAKVRVPVRLADERSCATLLNTLAPESAPRDGVFRLRAFRHTLLGPVVAGDDVFTEGEGTGFDVAALCRMTGAEAGFTRLAALDDTFDFDAPGWERPGERGETEAADPRTLDDPGFRVSWGRQRTSELLLEDPSTLSPPPEEPQPDPTPEPRRIRLDLPLDPGELPAVPLHQLVVAGNPVQQPAGEPVDWLSFAPDDVLDAALKQGTTGCAASGIGVNSSTGRVRLGAAVNLASDCTGADVFVGVGRTVKAAPHGSDQTPVAAVTIWGRDRDFRLQGPRSGCAAHADNGAVLSGRYLVFQPDGTITPTTCTFAGDATLTP